MKKLILQKIGDSFIMNNIQKALDSDNLELFQVYLEVGFWYGDMCEFYFGVELD